MLVVKNLKIKVMSSLLILCIVISIFSVLLPLNTTTVYAQQNPPEDEGNGNPPGDGINETPLADWVIEANDDITYSNVKIIVNRNLTIEQDGILTLDNVTLQMNKTDSDIGNIIEVEYGGELNIINGSTITTDPITPAQEPDPYVFKTYGSLTIQSSTVENMA